MTTPTEKPTGVILTERQVIGATKSTSLELTLLKSGMYGADKREFYFTIKLSDLERQHTTILSLSETTGLLSALSVLKKINKSMFILPNFEATYSTEAGLSFSIVNLRPDGQLTLFMTSGGLNALEHASAIEEVEALIKKGRSAMEALEKNST